MPRSSGNAVRTGLTMRRLKELLWTSIITVTITSVVVAQSDKMCPVIAQTALENARYACDGTGRNQACYGNSMLQAQPQPGISDFRFDAIGDTVEAADISRLRLSSMDVEASHWGVVLLEIQANLPQANPENVTLLLFGDVDVTNDAANMATAEMKTLSNLNIRRSPWLDSAVVDSIPEGGTVIANGRLMDNSWIRVAMPNDAIGLGWMAADGLFGAIDELPEVSPSEPVYGPMQAFTFSSGMSDAPCAEAPSSGLLIQTPEGVGEVRLMLNQVAVHLGSTVYFQAQPGNEMLVTVLEGHARITAMNETQLVPAGAQVSIPMNDSLQPSAPPDEPQPYDAAEYAVLASTINVMPQHVQIAEPISVSQLDMITNHFSSVQHASSNADEDSGGSGGGSPSIGGTVSSIVNGSPVGGVVNGTGVGSVIDGVRGTVDSTLENATGLLGEGVGGTVEGLGDTVSSTVGTVENTVEGVTSTVETVVSGTGDTVQNVVEDTTETVQHTVEETTETVQTTVAITTTTVQSTLNNTLGGLLGR